MGPLNGNVGLLENEPVPNLNTIADWKSVLECTTKCTTATWKNRILQAIADILAGILILVFFVGGPRFLLGWLQIDPQ